MKNQHEKMELFVKNVQSKLDAASPGKKIDREAMAKELALLDAEFGESGFKMLISLVIQTRTDMKVTKGRTGGTTKL